MSEPVKHSLRLEPIGADLSAPNGTPLRDLLFEQGVEFPCGGNGRCRGCKVRVLKGSVEINEAQKEHLSPRELADGWRLACQAKLEDDLVVELRQWDASILANDAAFEFTPQEGLGVAVDVGTTTLVTQLLDLGTGRVLGVRTGLNPQARHGGDVMSRIQFAVSENGHAELVGAIRHEVGRMVRQLFNAAGADVSALRRIVLVGNTVMHHLFCDIDLEPMSHYPFEPKDDGMQTIPAADLGWDIPASTVVQFLPSLGSFVGSDILAGILATGIHEQPELSLLVDLGTNGEMVLANNERILCSSTAAGPAFEGARIAMGMRASTGAIWKVTKNGTGMHCEVLGNGTPRGICGSGLVDAVAVGLDVGAIKATGRLAEPGDLVLSDPVVLTQTDIRQLQLAKGAIAAGIHLMLDAWGATLDDVTRVYLAGAFGNYINRHSAQRIGMLQIPLDRVHPVGNTALLGAKIALFSPEEESGGYASLRARTVHVGLNENPKFQDVYVDEMGFTV